MGCKTSEYCSITALLFVLYKAEGERLLMAVWGSARLQVAEQYAQWQLPAPLYADGGRSLANGLEAWSS